MAATTARSVINGLIRPSHTHGVAAHPCCDAVSYSVVFTEREFNLNREQLGQLVPRMPNRASAARSGQMAGNLRVHAHVVERAGRDRGDDVAGVGAVSRRRAVVSALPGSNCPDNQPYQQDEPTDSHLYLRRSGSSCSSEELRTRDVSTSTPCAADTRERSVECPADSAFRATSHIPAKCFGRRCIVSADGPGWQGRAARTCGTSCAHPSAGSPARRRRCRAPAPPTGPR